MPTKTLKAYLDKNGINYESIKHSPTFTAQETAEITHVSAKELAKTVMVNVDGKLAMIVVPAHHKVELDALKTSTGKKDITIASESEFQQKFPDCELGAMPPFGNLFDMAVYIEKTLTENENIAFNAGTHEELIKLSYADYEKHVKPTVI